MSELEKKAKTTGEIYNLAIINAGTNKITEKWVRLSDAQELIAENKQLQNKIKKFKQIAHHVQEYVCDECEDSTMCEFGCAITELKSCLGCEEKTKEVNTQKV